ncbi:MAG: hypothetical protein HOP30_13025 [Cyclobacteriaceae bacterium]|nr:hypothetical protein [Cyclobacteriaceae bacterium]
MIKEKSKHWARVIGIPLMVAFAIRFLFDVNSWEELWNVMTITFFISLPYLVGVLTIYLSKIEQVQNWAYSVFAPWIPIFVFLFLTLLLSIEGWACWIMVLPLFLLFASLGGLTGRYFKRRKSRNSNRLHISLAVLLPFFIAPIERAIAEIPGFYKAYTSIDIEANPAIIWSNVTRVRQIESSEDSRSLNRFLQIPRPLRAELDFEGVGAKREAIFEGGLIFDEKVISYEHQRHMKFSIRANTYEIPSTTFDEHVLIGGEFFDVLEGTYDLEKLSEGKYRLHLYSEFKMTTSFNFYASLWGKWIMSDIQGNILEVIKNRSERS